MNIVKVFTIVLFILFINTNLLIAQTYNNSELPTSINKNGTAPHSSAMLDVQSDSKGLLTPRMSTSKRTAIANPAQGLLVFDTTTNGFWFYSNSNWQELSNGESAVEIITENQKISTRVDGTTNADFNVDISGDYAIFGAEGINGNTGVAYIFKWSGSRWIEHSELLYSGATDTFFGGSVSISGDYAVVGATNSAYIFAKQADNWILQKQLSPDGLSSDEINFGIAVDIDANQIIVGSPIYDFYYNNIIGHAYVYIKSGNNWLIDAKLTTNNPNTPAQFGNIVSISGEFALIDDVGFGPAGTSNDFGRTFLFRKVNNIWIEQQDFYLPTSDEPRKSLNIFGDYIVINTTIFKWNGTDWVEDFKLSGTKEVVFSKIYGNYFLTSDEIDGLAKLYKRTDTEGWKNVAIFTDSVNNASKDVSAISIYGDKIIIGKGDGSLYFYQR